MNTIVAHLDSLSDTLVEMLYALPFAQRLHAGTLSRDEYTAFLVQTYHYVVHTRPFLHRAGERLEEAGYMALGQLLQQKAAEEDGHDTWLLQDLEAIGESPERVRREEPSGPVRAFVAWNSFVVEQGLPVGILGAAYLLEAVSARHAGEAATNMTAFSRIAGIAHGVRFLRGHGDADVGHIAALGQVIEAIASPPAFREEILTTARVTKSTYAGMYHALAC